MQRHQQLHPGLLSMNMMDSAAAAAVPKIRKRGCSSSSSTSSTIHNYRFKRAILVGHRHHHRKAHRLGGSRSTTPVPTWRSSIGSPSNHSLLNVNGGNKSTRPVSARRLAATLWEMNEVMPSPKPIENLDECERRSNRSSRTALMLKKDRIRPGTHSGSLPPHLSDPSHSPVSERIERSGTGSRHRRTPSISQKPRLTERGGGGLDSFSSASLMEVETRSRAQTPSGSAGSVRNHLKDVSNALTTSKELLKIINRIWAHSDPPSSSMSLISALHAELERARLQVNQLIQEKRSEETDINYLMKCFAEEKAAWKKKEQQAVESAIESIAGELEVERKLRRRSERLNKKLGEELAETKSSFIKVVKELETEKRAREIMEQACDELAKDVSNDRGQVKELKRESAKVNEEVEKEREMLKFADILREDRVQLKLSDAKYQYEEKNKAIDKLRKQLEAFLGTKKGKTKGSGSLNPDNDSKLGSYMNRKHLGSSQNEEGEDEAGEVENNVNCEDDDSVESDLHSIELNMDNSNKSYKWAHASAIGRDCRRVSVDNEMKERNSIAGQVARRSTSLLRSISDGVEWTTKPRSSQNSDGIDRENLYLLEKQAQRKSSLDEMQRQALVKGRKDQLLLTSRLGSVGDASSPTRQWEQPWPSRDPYSSPQERPSTTLGNGSRSRLAVRGEGQSARKSKR